LEKKHIKEIVVLMVNQLKKRLQEQEIDLELTDAALDMLSDKGFDAEYGARPLRRAIQKYVEDKLSEELLKGVIEKGQRVVLDVEGESFVIRSAEKVK
jgi:ATP-dependent Clp protease ATP-binding subunit ClpC